MYILLRHHHHRCHHRLAFVIECFPTVKICTFYIIQKQVLEFSFRISSSAHRRISSSMARGTRSPPPPINIPNLTQRACICDGQVGYLHAYIWQPVHPSLTRNDAFSKRCNNKYYSTYSTALCTLFEVATSTVHFSREEKKIELNDWIFSFLDAATVE